MVGTRIATWRPSITAMNAARSATSVLPKPASPQMQPVHRLGPAHVADHVVDRRLLIGSLLEFEALGEFLVVGAGMGKRVTLSTSRAA